MSAFVTKLTLLKDGFAADRPNLAHSPSCEEMRKTLQQQFKKRFQHFHAMQPRIELFTDPPSAAIREQPPELQLEMCEQQSDPFLAKRQERGISFRRLLPESRFHSSGVLHSQWPACLAALTSARATSLQ